MKILHLNLRKKWFDMIKSGEKKEEYREVKPYWQARLVKAGLMKDFDFIRFKNGYGKDAPTIDVEFLGSYVADFGNPLWGGRDHKTEKIFVLRLGKIHEKEN